MQKLVPWPSIVDLDTALAAAMPSTPRGRGLRRADLARAAGTRDFRRALLWLEMQAAELDAEQSADLDARLDAELLALRRQYAPDRVDPAAFADAAVSGRYVQVEGRVEAADPTDVVEGAARWWPWSYRVVWRVHPPARPASVGEPTCLVVPHGRIGRLDLDGRAVRFGGRVALRVPGRLGGRPAAKCIAPPLYWTELTSGSPR